MFKKIKLQFNREVECETMSWPGAAKSWGQICCFYSLVFYTDRTEHVTRLRGADRQILQHLDRDRQAGPPCFLSWKKGNAKLR